MRRKRGRTYRNRILGMLPPVLAAVLLLFGCRLRDKWVEPLVDPDESYRKAVPDGTAEDLARYDKEDETRVVTMYLTTGQGREEDGTNHTWTEINQNPLSYYEERNLEPYRCEAVLQVGDENGPLFGEFGYGETAANATVSLRGQKASLRPQKSYRIELKRGKGKWEEQKQIILNKDYRDPMRFTNKMMYALMQEIPQMLSVRTRFVHLYVKDKTEGGNGLFEDYGLFTSVEPVNGTYLENHGLDEGGELYRADGFELLDAANDPLRPIADIIEHDFDAENLYYWLGFQILTGNPDVKSYYLYCPRDTDRRYLISWDNDHALSRAYEQRKEEQDGEEAVWDRGIFPFIGSRLLARVFQDRECRMSLNAAVEDLKNHYLTEEIIREKAVSYAELIAPYVYAFPDRLHAPVTEEEYESLAQRMGEEIAVNEEDYQKSLTQPWPFAVMDPTAGDGGLVFRWEESYVFGEKERTYSVEVADSYMFEECLAKAYGIRETQYSVTLPPPGQYFVRIRAWTDGTWQNSGEYYITEEGEKLRGVLCFYVREDGTVLVLSQEDD